MRRLAKRGRQRQVVARRLFLDLDTSRTAEVLGIAPGTVTAHLARAIATLRADCQARALLGMRVVASSVPCPGGGGYRGWPAWRAGMTCAYAEGRAGASRR
jgi:DNA-binding CsgD family transcriptional regulator